MIYSPLISVEAPILVPSIIIEAPIRGSPDCLSVTFPRILPVVAANAVETNIDATMTTAKDRSMDNINPPDNVFGAANGLYSCLPATGGVNGL